MKRGLVRAAMARASALHSSTALLRRLDAAIAEIRSDDLAAPEELVDPGERVLFRLELQAAGAAEKRARQLQDYHAEHRSTRELEVRDPSEDTDWRLASEDYLYVRKRAEILGGLLRARIAFAKADLAGDPRRAFRELVATEGGGGHSTPPSLRSAR